MMSLNGLWKGVRMKPFLVLFGHKNLVLWARSEISGYAINNDEYPCNQRSAVSIQLKKQNLDGDTIQNIECLKQA